MQQDPQAVVQAIRGRFGGEAFEQWWGRNFLTIGAETDEERTREALARALHAGAGADLTGRSLWDSGLLMRRTVGPPGAVPGQPGHGRPPMRYQPPSVQDITTVY